MTSALSEEGELAEKEQGELVSTIYDSRWADQEDRMRADQEGRTCSLQSASRASLLPFQERSVMQCKNKYERAGVLLYGETGSGKTLISIRVMKEVARSMDQILVVVPSMGGNLPSWWVEELSNEGMKRSRVMVYSGSDRGDIFKQWMIRHRMTTRCRKENTGRQFKRRKHCDPTEIPDIWWCITTPDTLLSDIKIYGDKSPLMMTTWRHVICDEVHGYRHGTPHDKSENLVDPEKKKFSALMKVLCHSKARVLTLSGTPYFGDRLDLLSYCTLMNIPNLNKANWTIYSECWPKELKNFKDRVVKIEVPKEISRNDNVERHEERCFLSNTEITRMRICLKALARRILNLRGKFVCCVPSSPDSKKELLDAQRLVNAELVRARRGLVHPAFYDKPDRSLVKNAQISLCKYTEFPFEECTKFNKVIEIIKRLTNERILVTCQFSRPLDFLEIHLKRYCDTCSVIVHHGSRNCVEAMCKFSSDHFEKDNKVMLATHGTIGEGINMTLTTNDGQTPVRLICLDLPWTYAAQMQLEGRSRRPLAQPRVTEWHIHYIRAFSGENLKLSDQTIDQSLLEIIKTKEAKGNEVFSSSEECGHNEELTPTRFNTSSRGTLTVFEELCRAHSASAPC